MSADKRALLLTIYSALFSHYGPQGWWPTRSGSAWEIMLGAVLTQRTSWRNVELALDSIEREFGLQGLTQPEVVLTMSQDTLAEFLRPAGHYTSKPRKLQGLARAVLDAGGIEALLASEEPTGSLREWLLGIWGIGPETADAILLYALGRSVFVADAYALRLASRWGLLGPDARYGEIQRLFIDNFPPDARLFDEYHALIVAHGKEICRPRPLCSACFLNRPLPLQEGVMPSVAESWRCPRIGVGN